MHPNVPSVDVTDLADDTVLLDVREDEEWTEGHIANAIHIPMFQVPQHVQYGTELSPDRPVVVVCKVGARSAQVAAWLNQQGFQATNLRGGMLAWEGAGRPMVCDGSGPPRVV